MKKLALFVGGLLLALVGCDKGVPLENQPPDTRIFLTEINLVGEDRLSSQVKIHWYGSDADGYVVAYDVSLDGSSWNRTTATDSVFNFALGENQDTTDITLYVRSIDDAGDFDPDPAFLSVPIRNTAPTAVLDTSNTIPDTNFIATTALFQVDDLDGPDNLDSVLIKLNNGPWYALPTNANVVTFLPDDPRATGTVAAEVYVGTGGQAQSDLIQGLNLNGDNVLYLRAVDVANSNSAIDTSKTFFVRNQNSDLLVIDANANQSNPSPEAVLYPALNAAYPNGFDVIDMRRSSGINQPILWTPTFSLNIAQYDKIVWLSDASIEGFSVLENAAGAVQGYLNESGKLFVSTGFPNNYDNASVIQEFTPIDSISTSTGLARIPTGNLVSPLPTFAAAGYDTLEVSTFIGSATPFYVKAGADPMFTADILATGGWVGPDNLVARSTNASGRTNVVLISEQLHQLNGRAGSIQSFFNQVLNDEFNW